MKPYPVGYTIPQFQKFDGRRGNTREHVVRFLDSIRAHANDVDLCMRVTIYDGWVYLVHQLKPGSMHD